jgi:hypothetical protein
MYTHRAGNEKWDWQIVRFFYGMALTQGKYIALFWLTLLFLFMAFLLLIFVASVLR